MPRSLATDSIFSFALLARFLQAGRSLIHELIPDLPGRANMFVDHNLPNGTLVWTAAHGVRAGSWSLPPLPPLPPLVAQFRNQVRAKRGLVMRFFMNRATRTGDMSVVMLWMCLMTKEIESCALSLLPPRGCGQSSYMFVVTFVASTAQQFRQLQVKHFL